MGRDSLILTVEHYVDSGDATIQQPEAPLRSALVHVQAARAPYARLEAAEYLLKWSSLSLTPIQ